MMEPLVIWGASGHAKVVTDIVRLGGRHEIVGYIDDVNPERTGAPFCGATILGGRGELDSLLKRGVRSVIFGFSDCHSRVRLAAEVLAMGFSFWTAIHPRAVVAGDVAVGPGTVIMAGAVVNPDVRVDRNVIVNTSASVDHDCVLAEGVHVGPGVRLGGNVLVGRATWIGIGATVKNGLSIGSDAVVGAGAVVLRDIPDGVVCYGVPARVVGRRA